MLVGLVRFESCHSVFRCHGALPTRLRMSLTSSQDILKTDINRGDTVLELAQNNVNELKKNLLEKRKRFQQFTRAKGVSRDLGSQSSKIVDAKHQLRDIIISRLLSMKIISQKWTLARYQEFLHITKSFHQGQSATGTSPEIIDRSYQASNLTGGGHIRRAALLATTARILELSRHKCENVHAS